MSWFIRLLLPTASLLEAGARSLVDLAWRIGRWLVADWRNGPLVICALMWAAHALILNPALRNARDAARTELKATSEAFDETVKRYREAVTKARQDAELNVARVETAQAEITQEIVDDYEARLADARARAQRIYGPGRVQQPASARASGGSAGAAGVPGVPGAPGPAGAAAGEDRLPAAGDLTWGLSAPDALIATEQALQLQALIEWVNRQAAVPVTVPCAEGAEGDCE